MALHTTYTKKQAMAYAMAEIKSEMVGSNRDMEENYFHRGVTDVTPFTYAMDSSYI